MAGRQANAEVEELTNVVADLLGKLADVENKLKECEDEVKIEYVDFPEDSEQETALKLLFSKSLEAKEMEYEVERTWKHADQAEANIKNPNDPTAKRRYNELRKTTRKMSKRLRELKREVSELEYDAAMKGYLTDETMLQWNSNVRRAYLEMMRLKEVAERIKYNNPHDPEVTRAQNRYLEAREKYGERIQLRTNLLNRAEEKAQELRPILKQIEERGWMKYYEERMLNGKTIFV